MNSEVSSYRYILSDDLLTFDSACLIFQLFYQFYQYQFYQQLNQCVSKLKLLLISFLTSVIWHIFLSETSCPSNWLCHEQWVLNPIMEPDVWREELETKRYLWCGNLFEWWSTLLHFVTVKIMKTIWNNMQCSFTIRPGVSIFISCWP